MQDKKGTADVYYASAVPFLFSRIIDKIHKRNAQKVK